MWACSFLVVARDLVPVAQRYNSDSHCGAVVEKRCFSVRDRGGHWPFMNWTRIQFVSQSQLLGQKYLRVEFTR